MTTQLTSNEIERRLRFAAPDEPAVLPPLVLPHVVGSVRAPSVRVRGGGAGSRDARFAYAVIAVLLALALAATAGTLRLLNEEQDPLTTACDPNIGGQEDCLPVTVPDGWVDLGSGQFQSGEFAEPGLGYAFVQQLLATAPISCPTPGGPIPEAVPSGSGEVVEVPRPTPDAGLACLRTAALPDGAVRIVTIRGTRILAGNEETGGVPDLSEPTAEAGWTEEVAGRPARLTVIPGSGERPSETRRWDVLWPGSIETVLRIEADIAGPDLDAGRAQVQQVIDAVTFKWEVPPLDEGKVDDVLKGLLDQLDRSARESSHSDLYACFPRAPGSAAATIAGSETGPLATPLAVTCSTRVEPSAAGIWRIVLEVGWEAGLGYAADTLRFEYFSTGQRSPNGGGLDVTGGWTSSLTGRQPSWDEPDFSWFPNAGLELPSALDGPLNLSAGSIAKVLFPGESPAFEPGAGEGDVIYPAIVGTHVYVLEGPRVIDGEEWYRVQSGTGFPPETGWMRGTRDGRPQLEVVEPQCPAAASVTVGDVTWLVSAERVLCFGNRELTIEQGVLVAEEGYSSWECVGADNVVGPCPTPGGDWGWIAGWPSWSLFGEGGGAGPEPGMPVWLAPGVPAPKDGQEVRVRGHFNDPTSESCRVLEDEGAFIGEADDEVQELVCRERFVVTSIEPR